MKSILRKNIFREFRFSFARFISIATLLGLGVFVLIGLKVTGPDMRTTGNDYYTAHKMADAVINSNTGITKADQAYMRQLPHVKKMEFGTSKDAIIKGTNDSIRLNSKTDNLSISQTISGRLPKTKNEIALSSNERSRYKIGETLRLVNNQNQPRISGLKNASYKIVGFVTSSDYLMKENLGATSAGTGQLSTFGVVVKDAFTSTQPTIARLSYNNVHGKSYTDKYEKQVQSNVDDTEKRLNNRAEDRRHQLRSTALKKIENKEKELATQQTKLNQRKKQLSAASKRLKSSKDQLSRAQSTGRIPVGQLSAQQKQLTTQTAQLKAGHKQLSISQNKINRARQIMIDQRQAINRFPAITYQIQSRNDYNAGYNQFGENAKRIDVLSNTFPIIFFAVAILVSLTTMSRMAEEKRQEIGTQRALGYTKFDTMKVFLIYGTLAGLLGSIIGAWLGTGLLPRKIFDAYAANFVIPNFQTPPSAFWIGISILISLICTITPAVWVTSKMLKDQPATLMLPKPPKSGSKVLLEHVPFIWRHLSFNYKVTVRNLARYKGRMFMTIFGVLGCTALLITGFGIRDSLNGIVNTQYQNIIHYDVIGIFNSHASQTKQNDYKKAANNLSGVKHEATVYYESVTSRPKGMINNQSISMIVPKSDHNFDKFVTLKNPNTGNTLKLSDKGAIITRKMATLSHLKVGDKLTIKETNGEKHQVKIAGITEMYAGHSLYMNATYYHKAFDKRATYNAKMLMLKDRSSKNIDRVSRQLTRLDASVTAVQSDDAKATINHILAGLNHLVLIIIGAASLLAFVVLFTLTNINVSERIRELSTIKVLGFYPMEVVMYVYRETFILSLAGVLAGFVGGAWLHNYIMQTLPPETAMADMTLLWTNFTTSGVMTLLFSMIVMAIMAYKIQRVDMLGALKSVD
ncbi:FtsX-like permease family protein [Lentilactobacillus hilgardii]|nr:FtsX-like permease family protein [Lentilactobacillus hilgardii]MCV3742786.1 FtsX-like permease family protein [Lentilactobacillus hilgardii]